MESRTDSEESSIYTKLHEQFHNYNKYFKSKHTYTAEEDYESAVLETETKCKEFLDEMYELLNKKLENMDSSEAEFLRLLAMKCAVVYEKGRSLTYFGDEELGLKTMEEALELSAQHQHLSEFSFLVLKICNTSSYLQSRGAKYDKAYDILEEARAIYSQITDGDVVHLYTIEELFSEDSVITSKPETKIMLERLMTNNVQMLGFVCNKLGRGEDYFKYSHEVLERLLCDTDKEPTVWAMKASRLAFGFMTQTRFWEARNHLAAACHILNEYGDELKKQEGDTKGMIKKNEKLKHTQADVAKLWVKYCLYLLSSSKKRLISTFYADANDVVDNMWFPKTDTSEEAGGDEGAVTVTEHPMQPANSEAPSILKHQVVESQQLDEEPSDNQEKVEELEKNEEESLSTNEAKIDEDDNSSQCKEDELKEIPHENLHLFTTLALGDAEDQVTANIVETTEQARAVVTFAHSWLRRSKSYYTIGQYPTEYINGILDLSDLYRYLAFFEEDLENQYMVQKSRADALETLNTTLRDLRPPCHLTMTIELLRELAEVQLELVGLNLRRLFSVKGTYEEGDSELSPADVLQKMGALADLHGRLEHFGDSFAFITQPFQGFYEGNETPQQCT